MKASDLPADLRRKIANIGKHPKQEDVDGESLFAFQIKATGLPAPVRQYKFAESEGRKFAADFAWVQPEYKLIVEISGGIWLKGGGAHSRPQKIEIDMERQQYAAYLGFLMMPFSPDDVFSGHAIAWTEKTLRRIGWKG